jgi:predicted nucleic acid-binding protein
MKVVDASAILAVLLDEPDRAAMEARLAKERLVAPHLLLFEVANCCAMKARQFPDREPKYIDALADFMSMNVELRDVDAIGIFALARRYQLSGYDASYLWLSRELGAELVTLDKELRVASEQ